MDGRLALTVEQVTARYGFPSHMHTRKVLSRLSPSVEPVAWLDGRKPLYGAAALDAAIKARPGKGANLRGHG